ncbi:MAG: hypothetical protein ACQETH_04435 [Candidatus Rifleibacteriota bacterium]
MRKILSLLLVVFIFSAGSALADPYIDRMGQVIEEVSIVNLLRGLYLTREQADNIYRLTIRAQKVRQQALEEVKALNMVEKYEALREALFNALPEAPPTMREEVVEYDEKAHNIVGNALDKIASMEEEIQRALTPGQQDIFWEFVPCIVPEVDFENPIRAGQAAASTRLMPALELIRNTPKATWEKHGQAFVDHVLKITEQEAGKMTDDVREDLRRRLVKQCWKIRKMSEPDYLINKEKLAEDLLLVNREHTFRSSHRKTGKIARFFLSPAAYRVYPRWYKMHFGEKAAAEINDKALNQADEAKVEADNAGDANESQSQKVDDKDMSLKETTENESDSFWTEKVPEALAKLKEPPFVRHFFLLTPQHYSERVFLETDKYIDKETLINEAARVFLKRKGKLTYHSLIQGEP